MGIKDENMWNWILKATNNDCDLLVFLRSSNVSLSDWLYRSSDVLKFGTCIYINSNSRFWGRLMTPSFRVGSTTLARFSLGIKIRYLLLTSIVLLEVTDVTSDASSEYVYHNLSFFNRWDNALESFPCCLCKPFW